MTSVSLFRQTSRRHWLVVLSYRENRLLQCSAAWRPSQQHPEAGACPEHCRQDCSAGAKAIRLNTTTASAPLAAGPTVDSIQVSRADFQDPPHIDTRLPQLSHHSARRSVAALCTPLHFHCYPCRSTRLRSQAELSAALHLPPGTLCRTLWQLLTHWHLLNLG